MYMTPSYNTNQQQYRIVAEYGSNAKELVLAGFSASEQTEAILFRHLQNLCVVSDGSLQSTHQLLCGMIGDWQKHLQLPQAQLLTAAGLAYPQEKLQSICLYKDGIAKKLLNRIWM
jgi:hypothetical protein